MKLVINILNWFFKTELKKSGIHVLKSRSQQMTKCHIKSYGKKKIDKNKFEKAVINIIFVGGLLKISKMVTTFII